LREKNRWLRWMGLAALAAVSCQGALGILRVNLHALAGREFAMIHGCTAPLVFALLVGVAYLTSSVWKNGFGSELPVVPSENRLRRLGLLTTGLVYLQIVFGALVRHTDAVIGPRIHLLLAFAVVASAATLGAVYWTSEWRDVRLARLLVILCGLVGLQLLLGVEAWLCKFTTNGQWVQLKPLTNHPDLARSLHLLIGSLLFANTVVITLRVYLGRSMANLPAATSARQLEGAA
jgi:cytochrome c oxidase assembly protein subunit 15